MKHRATALFAFVALAWGGSYVAIDVGLASVPPLLFAAYRLDAAALVAVPAAFVLCDRAVPRTTAGLTGAAASGLLFAAGTNAFLFTGQQYTTGGVASVLVSTNPVLATGLASLFLPSERLDAVELAGVVVGLLGVAVVVQPSPGSLAAGTVGKLLVLCSAACLAAGSVVVSRIGSALDPLAETAWGLALGAAVLHSVSALAGEPFVAPVATGNLALAVAYLGVVSTALAYTFYFDLVATVGPVRANLVSYVVPVVTAVTGWLLLGQRVGPVTVAGFGVIAAGFALLNRRALASLVDRRPAGA